MPGLDYGQFCDIRLSGLRSKKKAREMYATHWRIWSTLQTSCATPLTYLGCALEDCITPLKYVACAFETDEHAMREHNYVCQLITTDEVRLLCFQYFVSVLVIRFVSPKWTLGKITVNRTGLSCGVGDVVIRVKWPHRYQFWRPDTLAGTHSRVYLCIQQITDVCYRLTQASPLHVTSRTRRISGP